MRFRCSEIASLSYMEIRICGSITGLRPQSWIKSDAPALMTVLRNEGRWDTSNVVYTDRRVLVYDKQHLTPEMHWIDYGLGGLKSEALRAVDERERDLAALYHRLAQIGSLVRVPGNRALLRDRYAQRRWRRPRRF